MTTHFINDNGYLLWQAANKWQRNLNKALKKHKLTHARFILLSVAAQSAGQSQKSLAAKAGIEKMMASKILRTLEKNKLLNRKESKNDSRSISIEITVNGKKLLAKAETDVKKVEAAFFKPLAKKQKNFNKKLKGLLA